MRKFAVILSAVILLAACTKPAMDRPGDNGSQATASASGDVSGDKPQGGRGPASVPEEPSPAPTAGTGAISETSAIVVEAAPVGLGSLIGRIFGRSGAQASSAEFVASRAFVAPEQFPPSNFAGYGVLVFTTRPERPAARARFHMFCQAFHQSFSTPDIVLRVTGNDIDMQVVTVLPLSDEAAVKEANEAADAETACAIAARRYDIETALQARRDAKAASDLAAWSGISLDDGRGPWLLAWNPGKTKGKPDALVLAVNLSNTESPDQAIEDFRAWREDIELNPQFWRRGFDPELVRRVTQRWLDRRLPMVLSLLSGGSGSQSPQ
ncbi:hypothetical protein KM176_21210 [Pseudooceanicola sp. CBS1P-1]|uniref:Uncharacterized protein n=1 Tax=Pseudooceanicola albus TaxID=2692189 RepID=A0A6L7G9T4_9RHOB|nr:MULTISPECIES: hypothetical protein [Pseudooceanicola]MBT9386400.1 hypothetical protein [Pseudooceanicola endophyticus]MXN20442.1 hypothetical protein [Pseudooceanicola albus]